MSTKVKAQVKPLPLSDILRDLAVLRSSAQDIPELFKLSTQNAGMKTTADPRVESTLDTSYEFVQVSRAAMSLRDSGKVEIQGSKIEEVRGKYKDLLDGLQ